MIKPDWDMIKATSLTPDEFLEFLRYLKEKRQIVRKGNRKERAEHRQEEE